MPVTVNQNLSSDLAPSSVWPGTQRTVAATLTGDTSYPTGGSVLTPAMFGTSLVNEYELLRRNFEFTDEQLREVARNSFEASFLPAEKKLQLLQCLDLTS